MEVPARAQVGPVRSEVQPPGGALPDRQGRRRHLRPLPHRGEAIRIILPNGDGYRWRLDSHPRLQWRWRAHVLPEGAREDRRGPNDTGAALYVILSRDWLGRPRTIKYTYSSTLPVGSTASYGTLKVLVASSARDGVGRWQTVARDVVEDYRALFGGTPASEPVAIALWNDSDSTQLARGTRCPGGIRSAIASARSVRRNRGIFPEPYISTRR